MTKFILLSFGFMGWAFYVLSGGSAFVPETRPKLADTPAATAPIILTGAAFDPAKADEVSRAETDFSLANFGTPEPPAISPAISIVAGPVTAPPTEVVASPEPVTEPAPEPVPQAAPLADTVAADLRVVAGSLVNMRDGPGTDYGVIAKVAGGTLAEVIEVDATGWVRIRLVDTNQTGWMAERLLAGG